MILPADQVRRVQRGDRTTIRLPVDTRLTVVPLRPAQRRQAKPFLPTIGQLLPVAQPAKRVDPAGGPTKDGWETVCHVEILNIARGQLGRLTDEQANQEGYETAAEFELAWARRHEPDWFNRQITQLVEGGTDPEDALETAELMAANRFPVRWSQRLVWTLTVRVEHDTTRFLARAGSPTGDYVMGTDPLEAGKVEPVAALDQRWDRRAVRRQLEALAENASPEERSRRARALGRRVRALSLQDPRLAREIEDLVARAEKTAA